MKTRCYITNPNNYDKKDIVALYKDNRETLSIPFSRVFDAMIDNKNFWILRDKKTHELIGMCGIKLKPRKLEYEIEHLVVNKKYRKHGYARILLYVAFTFFTPDKNRKRLFADLTLPVCAYANVGAENNQFYDAISNDRSVVHRKTMDLIRYVLDIDKIESEVIRL